MLSITVPHAQQDISRLTIINAKLVYQIVIHALLQLDVMFAPQIIILIQIMVFVKNHAHQDNTSKQILNLASIAIKVVSTVGIAVLLQHVQAVHHYISCQMVNVSNAH